MGNQQSGQTEEEPKRTTMIDEWEIPETYKDVGASEEVVRSLETSGNATIKLPSLNPGSCDIFNELKERKRAFDSTVQHMKHRFFGHREDVCADIEKEMTRCLNVNKSDVLICQPIQHEYNRCIEKYREFLMREPLF